LSFLAAVALARSLGPLVPKPHKLELKWPNDALVDGAKIAGILLESQSGVDGLVDWLTIGIGVNLAHAPQDLETRAVALADLGVNVQPMEFIGPLAQHMAELMNLFFAQGFGPIHAAWMERAAGLGGLIRVRLADQTLDGLFADLDPDGALVLDQGTAKVRIAAGEVFLNPAPISPA
jgi:BirA family biotin operon repressor/biotin-[acetyl-CoA-carboxylase] ligase